MVNTVGITLYIKYSVSSCECKSIIEMCGQDANQLCCHHFMVFKDLIKMCVLNQKLSKEKE